MAEPVAARSERQITVDDDAIERANYAICRFLFPGYVVPRSEMVAAIVVALEGEGDWKANLPMQRAAIGRAQAALSSRDATVTTPSLPIPQVEAIVAALQDGPKSSRELGLDPLTGIAGLREIEATGAIALDPDRFPDEYVPGNPLVARLPGDDRPWPGWRRWDV